jgi:hypothetical protein
MKVYLEEGAELLGLTTVPSSRQHTSSLHAIMKFMGGGEGIYIQGVPGGMCQTSGECSLC